MTSSSRRPRARYLLLGALLGLAITFLAVPWLIGSAYRGESIPLLNRLIRGQASTPVERYLSLWNRLALLIWLGLGALGSVWLLRPTRPVGAIRHALGTPPRWSFPQALAASLLFGVASGAVQGIYRGLVFLIKHHPSRWFSLEWVWMAPLSAGLAFLIIGAALLAFARLVGRRSEEGVSARVLTFLFVTIGTYSLLQEPTIRLHAIASWVLSAGVGTMASRWVGSRPDARAGLMRRVRVPVALALLASTTAGVFWLPGPLEQRRLSRLPDVGVDLPNILLVILDTVRASSMSVYGYPKPTTPFLDSWTREGVVFGTAVAPESWTLPSHATLFTTYWPHELPVRAGVALDDRLPTLAEVLAERGYHTAGFSANWANAGETSGIARGFHRFEDFPVGAGWFVTTSWSMDVLGRRLTRMLPWGDRLGAKSAEHNTDDLLDWLEERESDRPWFAFINYMDAHAPYVSPAGYRERFPSDQPVIQPDRPGMDEASLDGTRAAYDAAISYLDDAMKRIVEALESRGDLYNTLVIISSDHGEQLGEHGLMDHGNSLYEPVIRVPLLMVYPGAIPEGMTVETPVSIRDVAATIMDVALDTVDVRMRGGSLAQLWAPSASPSGPPPSPAFAASRLSPDRQPASWVPRGRGDMATVFVGPHHYIRNGDGVEELYDLADDPRELLNLAGAPAMADTTGLLADVVDSVFASPTGPGVDPGRD